MVGGGGHGRDIQLSERADSETRGGAAVSVMGGRAAARLRQGWEAAERGDSEDPKTVPNHTDLTGPALELAVEVGSASRTAVQARQDTAFRSKGLLPQFGAANQKISSLSPAQQAPAPPLYIMAIRRFVHILVSND